MVTVVVFEFSVMRCQPLRRALAQSRQYGDLETNGHCICKTWCA
ncbi:acetyltransferase [Vibrio cholerae]|nr:acetyltransferase [Vibrio cholerae]EHS7465954.1 acetyltransferase [Vibrio cholerae]EIF2259547.1 acetyltransferase [Vibrio cholerae]EJL6445783.1 acetyltransferase [Vibrio cholerae]EJU9032510.1 acetyltransferase [Vibrio cholerae]